MAPGGEFRSAVTYSKMIAGCLVQFCDRPIEITIRRALASLSVWRKIKLCWNIITSDDTISKEEVEKCKQKDLLEKMLEEMSGKFKIIFVLTLTLNNTHHYCRRIP